MIEYRNIQRYDDLEFGKYLNLNGYSHSFLKREVGGVSPEFTETDKVRLGKLVDGILTDPRSVDMKSNLYPAAKSIAYEIKTKFGTLIDKFEKQVSFSAELEFSGFVMPTTCRLDFGVPNFAVIDLKVTYATDVHALIKFMGYENQLWNYCKVYQVERQYILIYSVPLRRSFFLDLGELQKRNAFWENKVLKFGNVLTR